MAKGLGRGATGPASAKKMAPEDRGHKSIVLGRTRSGFDARSAEVPFRAQSPKYGRSPLRTAMRALVVSSRSIDAIRRVNREAEGASEIAAVLDILGPLFWEAAIRFVG